MSLPKHSMQGSLFAVGVMAPDFFPADDRHRVFREKIMPALYAQRKELCRLYCEENGRPAIEPVVLSAVTLLQFMEKVPDSKATEYVRLHLGWKYALDLEFDYRGFHPTSLVKFRERLLEGESERFVFDSLLDSLRDAGLVRKKSRQRLDSTHILGCVSKMSRLELVRETLRLFLEEVDKNGYTGHLAEGSVLFERYIDSDVPWHRLSREDLITKGRQAGVDALSLIKWLRSQGEEVRDSDKALLLERVFLEQYELGNEGFEWRRKEESGGVKNPHDPDVQWATKDLAKTKQWEGYKLQIAETVSDEGKAKEKGEPTEQFITEVITTEAIASDIDGLDRVLESQAENRNDKPSELYVDAGYVTDDTLADAKEGGYELTGPARPPGTADKTEFSSECFDVDVANRKAVCPAGRTSCQCSLIHEQKRQAYYRFEWAGQCDECPLRVRCTSSKRGRRLLIVGVHHDLLQARRREMQTDEFKEKMHLRNAIEGTVSEFARGGGRRTRYKGLAKTRLANYFHGAAANAKRWIRLTRYQIEKHGKAA
jgi:transposase